MKDSFNDFMNNGKLSNLDSAYYRDSSLDNLYDKKYGGFSRRAYKKAQAKLRRDQWEKATKLDINELANIGKTRAGMVDANYNNYLLNINGGYIPTQIGKHGLDVSRLLKSREIIQKYTNKPKELEKFQKGGKPELKEIKSIESYYDPDNNIIYYTDDEALEHERFHANPDLEYLEKLKPFYENLNDNKITWLGGDLNFVKRLDNDPGHFYNPVEIGARVKAAKSKTKGNKYTQEFFKNLRNNEEQYGDNMRDLLHMYNDSILSRIFNIDENIEVFQNGGTMNVIPEGALHARKHHMADDEHITKKGIPVVDTDGNQQAEIECNEIIFRKEVTDQLEKLRKEGSDEAAIEAGKLLAQEIVENTEDRTGLINTVVGEEEKLLTQQVPMAQKGIEIPKLNKDLEETKVPEKFDSFEDLLKYLRETGRESTEDYDLEKAYRDFEVFNDWLEEERKTPGKGHWKDKYKKPNHITYSNESILGDNPKENGGIWAKDGNGEDIFIVSPYLQKLHTLWEYLKYFEDEPISIMYDGVTYKTKKK